MEKEAMLGILSTDDFCYIANMRGWNMEHKGWQVLAFETGDALEDWLKKNHQHSPGIWLRIYKKSSAKKTLTFQEALIAGLKWGWSESQRHPLDKESYLQRFAPRKKRGTLSPRNMRYLEQLIAAGQVEPSGLIALGLESLESDS
jgi:uncharacterized protein YdeI (YjbR/CyaY-like superfamily)